MWCSNRQDRVYRWSESPMGAVQLVGRAMILKGTVSVAFNQSHRERVLLERIRRGLPMDAPETWRFTWRVPCR